MRHFDTIDTVGTKFRIRFESFKFIHLYDLRPRGSERELRDPRTPFERWLSWSLLAWALAAYVPFLAEQIRVALLPVIYGAHSERQAATYSVAYNFAHSTWNYFLPRIDLRGPDETGIIPTEAPTYSYLCGLLMRAFGDSAAIGRLLNLAASTLALVMVAVVHLAQKRVAALAGFLAFWVTSPACSVEFRNYQPDGFMTSFGLMAACWFMIFARSQRPVHFALGLASFAVACLSKPVILGCAPAMVAFSLAEGPRRPPRGRWTILLLMGIPPMLGLAWQWWATQIESHHSHVHWIDFRIPSATLRSNLTNAALWKQSFFDVLPTWGNGYCWLLVGIGVCLSTTRIFRARALGWIAWVAGTCIILATASNRIRVNCYYLTPLLPACAFFVSVAVEATVRRISRFERETFFLTWAAIAVASGSLAIVAWGHHDGLGFERWAAVVVVAFLVTPLVEGRPWATRVLTAVGLCFFLLAMNKGRRNTLEISRGSLPDPYFDDRTRLDDVAALRRAIDRYSTRDDRFLVVGGIPELHFTQRAGYAEPNIRAVDKKGSVQRWPRAPAFFVHYTAVGALPKQAKNWKLLENGRGWALYCTTVRTCEPRD